MTSIRVVCGLCLVIVLVATSAGSVGDFHEVPSIENECRSPSQDIPFSRAVSVPASDAAVNATVRRVNESAVRITYHDLESDEDNFGPSLPTWVYELGIRVASADGFDVQRSQIATTLVWNSSVRTPSVTFITERQPNSEFEDIGAAIQSEWAFLPVPPHTHPTNVSVAAGQQGFVGGQVLLLGDYEVYSRQVGCHDIQLYVPTALDTAEPPSAIVESIEAAARELRVGWRYETVRIFGVRSPIRVGGRAFTHEAWVHVNSTFGPRQTSGVRYPPQPTRANAWLHEYAHTRQRWVTNASVSSNAQWLTEAVPTYYMVSETERQGRMLALNETRYWERLNRSLRLGNNRMNLTRPDTYRDQQGAYTRGAFVLAALDQRLRSATNGQRSIENVFRRLNKQEQVTHSSFKQAVVAVGGDELGTWVDRYVSGTAVPAAPETPTEAYIELIIHRYKYRVLVGMGIFTVLTAIGIIGYRLRN